MTTFTVQLFIPSATKATDALTTTNWREAHRAARQHVDSNPTHTAAIVRNRNHWVETTKWYVGAAA